MRDPPEGERLVAEGTLDRGGLSIGLVTDGRWSMQVPITQPGRFLAVIEVPADGQYALIIANNLRGPSLRNQFALTRLAWARSLDRPPMSRPPSQGAAGNSSR